MRKFVRQNFQDIIAKVVEFGVFVDFLKYSWSSAEFREVQGNQLIIVDVGRNALSPILSYPVIRVEALCQSTLCLECKMATAILAQGHRLEDSGSILRPFEGDK